MVGPHVRVFLVGAVLGGVALWVRLPVVGCASLIVVHWVGGGRIANPRGWFYARCRGGALSIPVGGLVGGSCAGS